MQVRLLGPVGLADGERWTWLRGARVRTVLAALALHADSVAATEDLIVVLAHGLPWLVKRVAAGPGQALAPGLAAGRLAGERIVRDACVVVRGDNPVSQDSRQLGYVPFDAILGTMLRQL